MFRVHCFGFVFTPKLLPSIIFILILPVLVSLGFWQLGRADVKQQIATQLSNRSKAAPITLEKAESNVKGAEYYPITVSGLYDNEHSFLIDNKVVNHKPGYYVVTPFIPTNRPNKVLLVNRGWIPRGRDRAVLPVIPEVFGLQKITGVVKLPPKKVFRLQEHAKQVHWPHRIQGLELKNITKILNKPTFPFIVLLSPKNSHGFLRKWTFIRTGPEKHWGYAVQWFALGLTLVIIYIVVNTRRGSNERSRKKQHSKT